MPLFFFLSGFLAYKNEKIEFFKMSAKRLRTLLLPYVSALILTEILMGNVDIFDEYHSGFWFLLVLFEATILFYIVKAIFKDGGIIKELILWTIVYLALFYSNRIVVHYPNVETLLSYRFLCNDFPYFIMGYFFSKFNLIQYLRTKWIPSLFMCLWIIFYLLQVKINFGWRLGYGIGIAAICTLFCYFYPLSLNRITNKLSVFGKSSLEIYLIHYFLLFSAPAIGRFIVASNSTWNSENVLVETILCLLISVVIIYCCLIIRKIINKNMFLSFVFFGKRIEWGKIGDEN